LQRLGAALPKNREDYNARVQERTLLAAVSFRAERRKDHTARQQERPPLGDDRSFDIESYGMARDLRELIREATELAEDDRATLAGVMIESLDPKPTPEVKAAWSREIERRVREIDEGSVELIDWEEIRTELFANE